MNNLCGDPIEKGSAASRFAGCKQYSWWVQNHQENACAKPFICFTKDISVNYPLEDSVYIRFMGIIEDKNRFDNGK